MEYNKTKRGLEKASGIIGIVLAAFLILMSLVLIINAITYFAGAHDYREYYTIGSGYSRERIYYTVDNRTSGVPYLIVGLYYLIISILMLVFCIKLVKSPYNQNGELRKLQGARIWLLVLSIISGDLIMLGLMIAVLCMKELLEQLRKNKMNSWIFTTKSKMQNA